MVRSGKKEYQTFKTKYQSLKSMKICSFFLKILPVLVLSSTACFSETVLAQRMDVVAQRYSFEDRVPDRWNATSGSLSLSDEVHKHGDQSLRWDWSGPGPLILDNPVGLKESQDLYEGVPETYEIKFNKAGRYGGIKMWLYNEEAKDGALEFLLGEKGSLKEDPKYKFSVNLDFKGWRAVWVDFERDAKVDPGINSDEAALYMAILPPEEVESGTLYFDLFQFMRYVSFKRHSDTLFSGHQHDLAYDRTRNTILKDWQSEPKCEVAELTDEYRTDFEKIERRFDFIVLGKGEDKVNSPLLQALDTKLERWIAGGLKYYETLNIREEGGKYYGRPLYGSRDEHGTEDGQTFQLVSQEACMQLALDWKLNGNPSSKEKYIDLLNYYNEQGWASGHALGTVNHLIRIVGYGASVMLMREELRDAGILEREQETLQWYSELGHAFSFNPDMGESADLIRAKGLCKLISILLMEDSLRKVNAMLGFREYFHFLCTPAPGYKDTIKPDFTGFHHLAAYMNAYSPDAVASLSLLNYMLSGTSFQAEAKYSDNIKKALLAQRTMSNLYDMHLGVSGRFPHNNNMFGSSFYGFAYMAMSEKGSGDDSMQAAFKRLWNGVGEGSYNYKSLLSGTVPRMTYLGSLGACQILEEQGSSTNIEAEGSPQGNWYFPYAALAVHRRDNWMAAVRGWSQYVWDFESHHGENDFGRYVSHGAMFITGRGDPVSFLGSGYDLNAGFDWAMIPGATTKNLPLEMLQYHGVADEKYGEGKHRSFTDETFVGGLSLNGNGMFSMKLHDTVAPDEEKAMYDDTFRATKSYFFFDNEIVCLGSGISNEDSRYNTVTTLFQSKLTADANILTINGETFKGFEPSRKALKGANLLMDPYGNGYITTGDNAIFVRNSEQTSTNSVRRDPGTAPHSVAWIDHGKNPDSEGYEYTILVDTDYGSLERYARKTPYRILQKDENAHILHYKGRRIIAYALFNPCQELAAGPLKSANLPVMVMMQRVSKNTINLSVADPDLRLAKQYNMSFMPPELASKPSEISEVILEIKGKWNLDGDNPKVTVEHRENSTFLTLWCQDGLGQQVLLTR